MKTISPFIISLQILFLGIALQVEAETEAGNIWKTRRLDPTSVTINDMACNGSQVVTVGDCGIIQRSVDDGATWLDVESNTTLDLNGVTWTGSEWIAVGGFFRDAGVILRSLDAVTWHPTCLGDAPVLNCVASGSPGTVALGDLECVVKSSDNLTWSTTTDHFEWFLDVVWTGSFFTGVGSDGLIKKSTDGTTWTDHNFGTDNINGVAWNGTRLVAVGRESLSGKALILESGDGASWNQVSTAALPDAFLYDIEWTGSRFVAVGSAKAFVSPDGLAWSVHDLPSFSSAETLCWTGTRLLGGGQSGEIIATAESAPDETSDWIIFRSRNNTDGLSDLTMADVSGTDRIVTVGVNGTILVSDDNGHGFSDHSSSGSSLRAITSANFAPRTFLAVGSVGRIVTSPDGMSWTERTSGTTSQLNGVTWHFPINFPTNPILGIAVGHGGTIIASNDGITWSPRTSGTTETLYDVVSGLVEVGKPPAATRRIVAVGANGTILSSSSGSTWTPRSSGVTGRLLAVTMFGNKFVAVGDSGVVVRSTDGVNWSMALTGVNRFLTDVKSTGNELVAVGDAGLIFTSTDAINWTRRYGPYTKTLSGVHPLQSDRIGAVGGPELFLTSDPGPDFADWIAPASLPPSDDDPDDDPNGDGITNGVAYGHGIPPVGSLTPDDWMRLPRAISRDALGRYRIQFKTAGYETADLTYVLRESHNLGSGTWSETLRSAPGQPCPTGPFHTAVDVSANTVTVTFPHSFGSTPTQFTKLGLEIE